MPGLGTVVNVVAIIIGGALGVAVGDRMSAQMRASLLSANGVAVMFIGCAGALAGMLSVQGGFLVSGRAMLVVGCVVAGAFLGELANLDGLVARFGEWLKEKSGNAKEQRFVEGFATASMTVAVGAMAVIGAVSDALFGDLSILATKAVLDFVIVMAMACSLGRGCVFSAVSVGVVQGGVTIAALAAGPFATQAALANLGLVGSILIFCVGVNLVWGDKIKVLNMLPALILAPLAALLPVAL